MSGIMQISEIRAFETKTDVTGTMMDASRSAQVTLKVDVEKQVCRCFAGQCWKGVELQGKLSTCDSRDRVSV